MCGSQVWGEVFFCAGQSNMKLTVAATDDKDAEYAAAVALGPKARINFVGGNLSLDGPQTSPNSGNWTLGSTTPGDNGTAIAQFSAVCWAHGRLIAEWMQQKHGAAAPVIGMVEVSVGGTTIHHWVPDYVGNACNRTGILPSHGECVQYPPGWIYDGRMNPMLLDGKGFSAREVLYYQGEADSGENDRYTRAAYDCELRGLITSYRRAFGQPAMPILIIQLPGIKGTTGFQHDNDSSQGLETALGWQAIQTAQQDATAGQLGVGLVSVPDFGCCGLHYSHKFPVAQRAANITRQMVYHDATIDLMAPRLQSVSRVASNFLSLDLHFNSTKGLHLKPTYHCNESYSHHGWVKNVRTIQGQHYDVNTTCCSSSPAGHEGIGIIKMLVNTSKHPRHYWGGWVPATLTIKNDKLATATAFLPQGVNATLVEAVDINFGGMGCTLANANGMPIDYVPPLNVTTTALRSALPPAAPPAPTPCGCDVCDDDNPLPVLDGRIRIAAVGDSITRGHPLRGKALLNNYPCRLQRALGVDKFQVFNFGAGGHTMLKASPPVLNASKTYWNSTQFEKAKACSPHMVLVMLGTNDAVKTIWAALNQSFVADYIEMLTIFRSLASKPILHTMTTCPLWNGRFAGISQQVVNKVLPNLTRHISAQLSLPAPIQVFSGMGGNLASLSWSQCQKNPGCLADHGLFWGNGSYGCHPNARGYARLSGIVYDALKNDRWLAQLARRG